MDALADESITEHEFTELKLVTDFLKERNGNLGMADGARFFEDNPHILEIFESMKTRQPTDFKMQEWTR